jgi:carboxyl-terminal processing protease
VHSLAEAHRFMHGPPGTEVALNIWRPGAHGALEERQFTVVRELLPLMTVTTQVMHATGTTPVGLITIQRFHDNTAVQFRHALDSLQAQGIDKIVIDLRNNPGGSLLAAVRMLALFMRPEDIVVELRGRHTQHRLTLETLRAEYGVHDVGLFRGLNLVILINGGSASAAEIFAGVLQDWGYPVVGETSFGKGVAQSPITLSDN